MAFCRAALKQHAMPLLERSEIRNDSDVRVDLSKPDRFLEKSVIVCVYDFKC